VKCLVYIFEDWEIFERYGTEQQNLYQLLFEGEKIVIKVVAGDVGFHKEFDNPKDPLLIRIIVFCKYFAKLKKDINIYNFFR
jgi:hypothetical protein